MPDKKYPFLLSIPHAVFERLKPGNIFSNHGGSLDLLEVLAFASREFAE